MKKLQLILALAVSLSLFSCREGHKQHIPPVADDDEGTPPVAMNCCKNYHLTPYAVTFWQLGWDNFIETASNEEKMPSLSADFSNLTFEREDILDLRSKCDTCNGMRIYFGVTGIEEGIHQQCLFITNVDNCSDQVAEGDSLLCSQGSSSWYISTDSANRYRNNWRNYFKDLHKDRNAFVFTEAYNFEWQSIDSILTYDNTANVQFMYGVHTLTPPDTSMYDTTNMFTSCGGDTLMGGMVFNLIIQPDPVPDWSDGRTCASYDFANPCPRYCIGKFYEGL